jgi:hypothetical protein
MTPPPPLLLGATLLFWGWQAGFPLAGILMALALEGAHLVKARWTFSNDDFSRIWTFCTLLLIAGTLYSFTVNEGPSDFLGLFQNPSFLTQRNAGAAAAKTAAALLRWLPMIFFLFVAAQAYSTREGVPLETISLILRARWKKAARLGQPPPPSRTINVGYPYFGMCLFSASIHSRENTSYFWGVCALLAWVFWSRRSRRFPAPTWALAFGMAGFLAYHGQAGLGELQRYIESLNPPWLSSLWRKGFDPRQTKTMIGEVGRLKNSGRILLRVQAQNGSKAPGLLREASYRIYKPPTQTWYAGEYNKDDFENIQPEEDGSTFVLLKDKTNTAQVNIACYLPGGKGLLAVPPGCARIEKVPPYTILQFNGAGCVQADGPGLLIFDAQYGPGTTIDSPAEAEDITEVPRIEAPVLEQIVTELGLQEQSLDQATRTLERYFQTNFEYSIYQGRTTSSRTNLSPLSYFLLRSRRGHCEYFATATVLLLRQAGFAARYAVGYAVHETSGEGRYVVRERDAHAWCLVWNEKHRIWQDLDTTPGSWVQAEGERASPFQWFSDLRSRIWFEISNFRWGQGRLRQYILWALVPVMAILLYQILSRASRQRHQRKAREGAAAESWPGLDSEVYELERKLAGAGLERHASEPLSEWLRRAGAGSALAGAGDALRQILGLHYRYRFDPKGLLPDERDALRTRVRGCLLRLEAEGGAGGRLFRSSSDDGA